MSHYNELPFVVVNNNGVEVKLYDVDLDKYIINEGTKYNNVTYVSLDGGTMGRVKTRPYAQYTSLTGRTGRSSVMMERRPDYFGCTLDEEFKSFDNWVKWAETKIGFMCTDSSGNVYQIDKDLINYPERNKHYSPKNCVFLPPSVNSGLAQLGRIKLLETKRKFFNETFENYFETLDEVALGKLIEICEHEHSLAKFEVKTEETLKVRNKYDVFLSKIYNWEEFIDVGNFNFSNGLYYYKQTALVNRYETAKESILSRIKPRLEELHSIKSELELDKMGKLGNWWRLEEFEKVMNKKLKAYTEMVNDVEQGNIKLPHYVLTWV